MSGCVRIDLEPLGKSFEVAPGTLEAVAAAIAECRRQAGPRYIIGAGCEVARGTPEENIWAMSI